MDVDIVIDLGFGDSGKGLCVDYLVSKAKRPLVVRFSGGHQVGHTVSLGDVRHTFSNFGAGTLRGAPTYYSEHCTAFPPAMVVEASVLPRNLQPRVYFHPHVMITTPYDMAYNRAAERINNHGSCGVGFGATCARHKAGIMLYAQDLEYDWVLRCKLNAISDYYRQMLSGKDELRLAYQDELGSASIDSYLYLCEKAKPFYEISLLKPLLHGVDRLIFEGSQGVMLDQVHGVFPHVTPSYTTSKNAFEIIDRFDEECESIKLNYVTRCYQTRHGNGPVTNCSKVVLSNNDSEANTVNQFQGDFRTVELDVNLLDYALMSDSAYHGNRCDEVDKVMYVTCLDQRLDFELTILDSLILKYDIESLMGSYGPSAKDVEQLQ